MVKINMEKIGGLMKEKVDELSTKCTKHAAPEEQTQEEATESSKSHQVKFSVSDVRKRHQKMYEEGILPPLHKAFFDAIKTLLAGEKEGLIKMSDATKIANISTIARRSALAGLVAYEYIEISRVYGNIPGEVGCKGSYVKILRDPKH